MQTIKNNKEIHIIDLVLQLKGAVLFLWSKKIIVFSFCFLFGLAGIAYAWFTQPKYTAEMTFALDTERSGGSFGGYAGIAAQFGLDIGSSGAGVFEGDNLIEFLNSRLLAEKTLRSKGNAGGNKLLIDVYIDNHELKKKWAGKVNWTNIKFETVQPPERVRDSIMTEVCEKIKKSGLSIERKDKKLSFVVVKMTDNDEVFVKTFVETLASNAIEYYVNYKSTRAKRNVQILERQVDSIRNILDGGIDDVASGNDLNINPLKQKARTNIQKRQIDVQTSTLIYGEALKNLALSKVILQKETPLIQIIDKPVLPIRKIKPGRLLSGIIFSVVGFFIIALGLIVSEWIRKSIAFKKNEQAAAAH